MLALFMIALLLWILSAGKTLFVDADSDTLDPGSVIADLTQKLTLAERELEKLQFKYDELVKESPEKAKLVDEKGKLEDKIEDLEIALASQEDEPPIITLDEASKIYLFPSGKAQLSDAFRRNLAQKTFPELVDILKKHSGTVDTIEIVGHTDGDPVGSNSNLDRLIPQVLVGQDAAAKLKPGSNADLGLMRALAVREAWYEWLKRMEFYELGRISVRCYSAGQTIPAVRAQENNIEQFRQRDAASRRIEIRFTDLDGNERDAAEGEHFSLREATAEQKESIAAIEKLGGRVTFDPVFSVNLHRCTITAEGLVHLTRLGRLEELIAWESVSDAELAPLKELTNLGTLDLSYTEITDAGLVHLKNLTNLRRLDLAGTKVRGDGLANLTRLANLEWLSLINTQASDAGLSHLKGMPNLKFLSLALTKISDAGVAHLEGLTKLENLILAETNVTDAGLVHLKGLTKLEELFLNNTKITDVGVAHLKGLTKLRLLNLDGAGVTVTDDGLAHLTGLTNLENLWINNNKITDAGMRKLQAALPACEINEPALEE